MHYHKAKRGNIFFNVIALMLRIIDVQNMMTKKNLKSTLWTCLLREPHAITHAHVGKSCSI